VQAVETERETLRAERDVLRDRLTAAEAQIATLSTALADERERSHRAAVGSNGTEADGTEAAAPAPSAATLEELAGIEQGLRSEIATLSEIEARLETEIAEASRSGGDGSAEIALLHATLEGYRQRAARLREEIEGCRGRMESLSAAELSGFLEELGEDLAELAK